MPRWLKNNGLLLANAGLFVLFLGGMVFSGVASYNDDQLAHGRQTVDLPAYLRSGHFMEAVFENWESEFLQMAMYVVLTIFLFQKGSSESKPLGKEAEQDENPRHARITRNTPWPVRKGGWILVAYEHSLSGLLVVLFLGSILMHAVGGAESHSEEQLAHGLPPVSIWQYMASSQFWFESFQNWQSEFLAVAVVVGASVFLRERGSPESKRVAEPHHQTGA